MHKAPVPIFYEDYNLVLLTSNYTPIILQQLVTVFRRVVSED